jgi:hypothetical protein
MHLHDLSFKQPDFPFRRKIERIRFGLKLPTVATALTAIVHSERTDGPSMYK